MTREEIYHVLEGERDYQDSKWGDSEVHSHEVPTFVLYMEHHLAKARTYSSTETNDLNTLHELRKVAALALACFEVHGVPQRVQPVDLGKEEVL